MERVEVEKIITKGCDKEIVLLSEIWFVWKYSYKKKIVSSIGSELAKQGFNVTMNHKKDDRSGIYKIHLILPEDKILIFSNNPSDKGKSLIFAKSAYDSKKEIFEAILAIVQ